MTTLQSLRTIRTATSRRTMHLVMEQLRHHDDIGSAAWHANSDRATLSTLGLDGWPRCECSGCDCDEPATCTDDQGVPTCAKCHDYTTDDDGCVHCGRCDDVETVVESCGAGNQSRSYLRIKPPAQPPTCAEGEFACWWETAGDDARLISRHATLEEAEQAVAAHDFPRPGDNTHYLCGYGVRRLVDGEWVGVEEDR